MVDQDMFGVKQIFGIFSPTMGLKKDFPVVLISKVFTPDNSNILLKDGKIIRRKMRERDLLKDNAKVQIPDGNPIIYYHTFIKRSTGTQYFLAFTKAHIYHWNPSTEAFDTKWTNHNISVDTIFFTHNAVSADTITDNDNGFVTAGFVAGDKITITGDSENNGDYTIATVAVGTLTLIATDELTTEVVGDDIVIVANCENWEVVSYNDKIIATNNVDKVLVWTTAGNFVALDDTSNGIEYETGVYLTKAKHLIVFENYLILGYTHENGSYYPQRFRWNDIGDETEWITGTSGSTEVGKSDFIKGFGLYQGYLIVFKGKSYYKYWLVASPYIFNGAFISMEIGCRCSGSIINDNKGRLYWYASDGTIKEISVGTISQPIQTDIIDRILQSSVDLIKSSFIEETGEVWWSIPYDNALNNKVITLKEGERGERIWGQLDLAIPAFGSYTES